MNVKLDQRVAIEKRNGKRVAGIVTWFTPSTIGILRFDGSDVVRVRRDDIEKLHSL